MRAGHRPTQSMGGLLKHSILKHSTVKYGLEMRFSGHKRNGQHDCPLECATGSGLAEAQCVDLRVNLKLVASQPVPSGVAEPKNMSAPSAGKPRALRCIVKLGKWALENALPFEIEV